VDSLRDQVMAMVKGKNEGAAAAEAGGQAAGGAAEGEKKPEL